MKENPIFTPNHASGFKFQTFGDPVLEQMAASASRFKAEVVTHPRKDARWLTFLGGSGVGKTYLADALYQAAMRNAQLIHHPSLVSGVWRIHWPTFLKELRNQQYHLLDDAADANFLMIDELVLEHDPTKFGADKMSELFGRRVGKWTVSTSNLSRQKIADIDIRIISRIIRDENEVVKCDTLDYALRKQ